MKIGIDISQIAFPGTGVATYTRNLVEHLLSIDKKDEFILFGGSLRRQQAFRDFTAHLAVTKRFYSLPPLALDLLWNKWHELDIETFTGKFNVFHTSDWTEPPSRLPKVTTIHDLLVLKYPEFSHKKTVSVQKRKLHWVVKESSHIIADSQATKKDLLELLEVEAKRVSVIPLAASPDFLTFVPNQQKLTQLKNKYHLTRPYILAVGTREPRKNLFQLLAAYKLLKNKKIDLVIAGKFGWGKDIEPPRSGVKLLGLVPQEDLPALFSAAHAFVFPSLYEGFGVPVLEALTIGTPVITSNVSSLPEVGGSAALYVDPHNAEDIASKIDQVLSLSTKDYQDLQTKSHAQASQFSWTKTAEQTLEIYLKFKND